MVVYKEKSLHSATLCASRSWFSYVDGCNDHYYSATGAIIYVCVQMNLHCRTNVKSILSALMRNWGLYTKQQFSTWSRCAATRAFSSNGTTRIERKLTINNSVPMTVWKRQISRHLLCRMPSNILADHKYADITWNPPSACWQWIFHRMRMLTGHHTALFLLVCQKFRCKCVNKLRSAQLLF